MIVFECAQGSEEWFNLRAGIPTCSNFSRIITTKGKPSAGQSLYIAELIAEEVAPDHPSFHERKPTSRAMDYGVEHEHASRLRYELETGNETIRVGFLKTDNGHFGGSPDSLIGGKIIAQRWEDGEGGLELKNPDPKQHVKYKLKGTLPNIYRQQVHGYLAITGAKWWDFASMCDGFEPFIVRVIPDDFTEALKAELVKFYEKLQDARAKLIPKPAAMPF